MNDGLCWSLGDGAMFAGLTSGEAAALNDRAAGEPVGTTLLHFSLAADVLASS